MVTSVPNVGTEVPTFMRFALGLEEARRIHASWFDAYPAFRRWQ